jgi:predicted dienelactone hydrolase
VQFVLDELARRAADAQAPWALLRADAIGLAGHSFGAQTTQAIAGQRFPVPGDGSDPRPRAFIAFSPSQSRGGRISVSQAFGGITRPLLLVTGSEDGDPLGSYDRGDPRAEVYDGLPPGQRALLWLDGADHMSFAGQNLRQTAVLGPLGRRGVAAERQAEHQARIAQVTTDWWRAQLLGDTQARAALRQPKGLGERDRWRID